MYITIYFNTKMIEVLFSFLHCGVLSANLPCLKSWITPSIA